MSQKPGSLYLGSQLDPADTEPTGQRLNLASDRLTTHGVIVGMTGSGKTGLGIVLVEEVLASGIPVLILDPKGDMGNLLLNFPSFSPDDFEPWVDPGEARRKGMSPTELATSILRPCSSMIRRTIASPRPAPRSLPLRSTSTR